MMEENPYQSPSVDESPKEDGIYVAQARPASLLLIAMVIGVVMTAAPRMPWDPHHEFWVPRAVMGCFLGLVAGIASIVVRRFRRVG